ncbi:BUB3.1 [Symbiodinium microadriaticum]|nr:BUB3.1 [Symbiodinium microadriaticum]
MDFSPQSNLLLLSSWDSTVRLYNTDANRRLETFNFPGAMLSCSLRDDDSGFACGLDCSVHMLNSVKGTSQPMGSHTAPASCLDWCPQTSLLYSGSWDSTVAAWDARSATGAPATTLALPGRVYSLSVAPSAYTLVVATADRHVLVYDTRSLAAPVQTRESPLRHQTRKVACFPNGCGFAIGSVEGRVGVEYLCPQSAEGLSAGLSSYAFKCHRRGDVAYPVNAIAFHPVFGTFATGGGDGTVNVWDGDNKKKLCQLHQYPTSIASLAFSRDGSMLAIASSYTFEEGEKQSPPDDNVVLRRMDEVDVKPRPKQVPPAN